MKNGLKARRQEWVNKLDRVNREIALTQKDLARIESRIAALRRVQARAA